MFCGGGRGVEPPKNKVKQNKSLEKRHHPIRLSDGSKGECKRGMKNSWLGEAGLIFIQSEGLESFYAPLPKITNLLGLNKGKMKRREARP